MSPIEEEIITLRRQLESRMMEQIMRKQKERTCPTCGHIMDDEEYARKQLKPPTD
jgi:hypothetical protein